MLGLGRGAQQAADRAREVVARADRDEALGAEREQDVGLGRGALGEHPVEPVGEQAAFTRERVVTGAAWTPPAASTRRTTRPTVS